MNKILKKRVIIPIIIIITGFAALNQSYQLESRIDKERDERLLDIAKWGFLDSHVIDDARRYNIQIIDSYLNFDDAYNIQRQLIHKQSFTEKLINPNLLFIRIIPFGMSIVLLAFGLYFGIKRPQN